MLIRISKNEKLSLFVLSLFCAVCLSACSNEKSSSVIESVSETTSAVTTTKAVTTTLSTKPKQVTTVSTTAENLFETIPINADTKLMYEAYQSEFEGYGRPEWYSYIEINKNDIIPPPEASYKVSSREVHESEYGHKILDNFAICYYDNHNNLLVEYYGYSDTSQPDIMYYSDLYS